MTEPSLFERLAIGARCVEMREAAALKALHEKTNKKVPQRIRELQKLIYARREQRSAAIRKSKEAGASRQTIKALIDEFKRYEEHSLARIRKEVTPILDRMGRHVTVHVTSAMTREVVQKLVAKEYREAGRPEITARRVKAYWTEYANFLKDVAR
jgi:hypothetical protein